MRKKAITAFGTTALLGALLALPAGAVAEEAIPPGNSAVNQYTESLPTPTGHTDTDKGGAKAHRSPDKTLGSRNAERLESHGPDGRAAAEAAAATAPAPSVAPPPDDEEEAVAAPPSGNDGGGGKGKAHDGGGKHVQKSEKPKTADVVQVSTQIDEPSGSSGFGEAFGEATGTSGAGQVGWLLPLLIVATTIWALAYGLRHRRRVS